MLLSLFQEIQKPIWGLHAIEKEKMSLVGKILTIMKVAYNINTSNIHQRRDLCNEDTFYFPGNYEMNNHLFKSHFWRSRGNYFSGKFLFITARGGCIQLEYLPLWGSFSLKTSIIEYHCFKYFNFPWLLTLMLQIPS